MLLTVDFLLKKCFIFFSSWTPQHWFLKSLLDLLGICVISNSVTLWTVARQPPLSMGFSRQEYWSGLPCLPAGGLPNPGMDRILWLLHCRQILYPLSHPECHLIRNRTVSISQLGIDHVAWSVMCSIGSVWAPPSVRWGWALKPRIGTEQSIAFFGRTDA